MDYGFGANQEPRNWFRPAATQDQTDMLVPNERKPRADMLLWLQPVLRLHLDSWSAVKVVLAAKIVTHFSTVEDLVKRKAHKNLNAFVSMSFKA